MKKTLFPFLIAIVLLFANSYAQNSVKISDIAQQKNTKGWIKFLPNKNISPEQVFTIYKNAFGLTTSDEMRLSRSETDLLGYSHNRYQQYYKGIPVEGGVYLIHSSNGKANSGNGKIMVGLNASATPAFNAKTAISKAIQMVNAERYMWENPNNETMLKQMKKDVNATYYPKAELVFIDKKFSDDVSRYVLAWKVNVYAEKPLSYQNIYINAISGEFYHKMDLMMTGDVQGTAHTKYSGVQTITTDSMGVGSYRLKETGRCGLQTYNMLTTTNYGTAVDFTDTDNNWNNVNAGQDEVATDAHFGAEKTYDFYLTKFGRQSYDNLNSPLYSYVHYDVGYANAFWDGTKMTYGDGDGTTTGPFTALDVCGHEITHGVTQFSANLIYQDESGGLNEAFSDIMGAAIEFYASPATGDWYVGEDFDLSATHHGFRNMANPNEFQQPDTYLGTYWYVGVMDNGGVHTNSGVANYWYYLLTEGGSGTNDIGNVFTVTGIGLDKSTQIAYRALTSYMTSTSKYFDTREATLQAAIDLYGPCSPEYISTANAWYAVGVGQAVADNDVYISEVLSPKTDCGLTSEPVKVRMIYNGCSTPVNVGEKIHFYYKADGGAVVSDSLILASNLNGGDTIDFTFSVPADVHVIGPHSLNCWLHYASDTVNSNDTLATYNFVNKLYQNSDVGVKKIISPVSECHMGNSETVTIQVAFYGCEFLPAGNKIPVSYTINAGSPVNDTITTPWDFYPDSVLTFSFASPANLSATGNYNISAATHFGIDSLNTNDALSGYVVKNPYAVRDTTITFDEVSTANNFLIKTGPYGHALVSTASGHAGKIMKMTGGNVFSYINQLQFPDGTNTWTINDFLSAKVTFCVDATSWTTANMRFDLKQTFGKQAYELYLGAGQDFSIASNMRILVNGTTQISQTFNPTTASADPFASHYFNLDAYAGTKFTVTFETRNISSDTIIFVMDNAYLENVKFMEHSDVGVESFPINDYISVYPNPVTDLLSVNYYADKAQDIQLQLLDLQGKVIQSKNEKALNGQNQYRLDMHSLPSGIYFIRIATEIGVYNNKIVKQ
ncbi:MAG: M4 family metallopeptidase [Bacteroidota bacterium]